MEDPSVEKVKGFKEKICRIQGYSCKNSGSLPYTSVDFFSQWVSYVHTEQSVGMWFSHSQGSQDWRIASNIKDRDKTRNQGGGKGHWICVCEIRTPVIKYGEFPQIGYKNRLNLWNSIENRSYENETIPEQERFPGN